MHRPHALASDLLIDATVVSAVGGGDVVGKRNFAFRFTIASVHQIEHHWGQVPGSRIRSQVSRGHKSSWHLGGQLRFFVCKNSVGRRHLVLVLECVRDSTLTLALTTASRPTNHECWHRGDPLIWDLLPTPSNSSTSVASRKITGPPSPQSLHPLRRRPCSQMPPPPQSLQWLRCRPCSHFFLPMPSSRSR